MPTFEYFAKDAAGQTVTGTVLGSSLDQALSGLHAQGLIVDRIGIASSIGDPLAQPVAVQTTPAPPPAAPVESPRVNAIPAEEFDPTIKDRGYFATRVVGPVVDRVPLRDLMFFFRQFATMQKAGVPIVQSLATLSGQSRDGKLSSIIKELGHHVEVGRPISFGMSRYPEVFSPLILSIVRAGEESGQIDRACSQIADYLGEEIELRNLYRRVTFMPKLTVFTSIAVIGGANLVINSLGRGTPIWSPLTQISTWFILAPIIVGIFLFFRVGLANPRIRHNWDAFILRIPYLGHTLRQFSMAKFGRAFGALYAGGVPIPRAVQLAADACGNEYMRSRLHPASARMEGGHGIGETLSSMGVFSPIVLDMIKTGETTGNMDQMLTKMSEFYEDEAKVRSQQLGQVLGVACIIAVGIYVLIVLVRFYSGYFQGMFDQADRIQSLFH